MRVKEAIYKIKSHPVFSEIEKLKTTTIEEFNRRYNFKLYPYRHSHGPADDYTTGMGIFLSEKWVKQLPEIHYRVKFDFGLWGPVVAFIHIQVDRYQWGKTEIKTSLTFDFLENRPKLLWDTKFNLPLNFDLSNPVPQLKAILKPYFFEAGIIAHIQKYHNCTKKEVIWYKKNRYSLLHQQEGINEATIYKAIKKRFNVDSFLSIPQTISFVNSQGKLPKMTKLERYDSSWIFDFDGDMEELETEFYNSMEDNTIYV